MMSKVTAMPILYGLIRWSSDEQGSGSSLQRQRDSISAYGAELGARLIWLPTLDGVSARHGANLDHPVMVKFRDDMLNGRREAGILCVDEPSRFSRGDLWKTLAYLAPLMQCGMQFAVASRRLLLRPDDQSGLMTLFGFLMEGEGGYRENEKRVGQVKAETALRRQTLRPGVVYSARMPDWLFCPRVARKGAHERVITAIPERAALAVEMMELSAAGFGSVRLAQLFNRRFASGDPRYASWRGTAWTPDAIKNLTSNRALIGEHQPHEIRTRPGAVPNPNSKHKKASVIRIPVGEAIQNYFPAIVGRDLWNRVEAAKVQRARVKTGRPSRDNVNLFTGLCHCGACGKPMHLRGSNHRGKNDYVVCSGYIRHTCDNGTYYSVTRLERVFLQDGLSKVAAARDFTQGDEHADALAAQLDQAKLALDRALRRQNNVRAILGEADTAEERAVVRHQLADETAQVTAAQGEHDRIERALDKARESFPDAAMRLAETLVHEATQGDAQARIALGEIIRATVARVEFLDGRVFISPARTMTGLNGNEVMPRRLVVEYGHNARGRHLADDDEILFVEGMDSRNTGLKMMSRQTAA